MATELLVTNRINGGEELLAALDRARFPVDAALWYSHEGTWRYLIGSLVVDKQGPKEAYRRVNQVLRRGVGGFNLSDITVLSSHDPLLRLLRSAVSTPAQAVAGIRFGGNTINNVFIEDAYIYRLA
jgi:hypothetical protein